MRSLTEDWGSNAILTFEVAYCLVGYPEMCAKEMWVWEAERSLDLIRGGARPGHSERTVSKRKAEHQLADCLTESTLEGWRKCYRSGDSRTGFCWKAARHLGAAFGKECRGTTTTWTHDHDDHRNSCTDFVCTWRFFVQASRKESIPYTSSVHHNQFVHFLQNL